MNDKKARIGRLVRGISPQRLLGDLSHAASLERYGPKVFERITWRVDTDEPRISLTFDDGPHDTTTPKLLEILEKNRVPATFFLVGKHAERHFPVAQQIVQAGHEIGNHTFNHVPLSFLSSKKIREEISRAEDVLSRLNGTKPRFMRPPGGLFTPRVLDIVEDMGYRLVIGDVYPRDSHRPGRKRIVQRILKRTKAGSIIILHDGGNTRRLDRSQTLSAVEDIIPRLIDLGFRFVLVSTLTATAGPR